MWVILLSIFTLLLFLFVSMYIESRRGPWDFETTVIRGKGKSKDIDWKTANLERMPHGLQLGFYACETNYGVGTMLVSDTLCEIHIHKFNSNIYDKKIKIKNIRRIETPMGIKSLLSINEA